MNCISNKASQATAIMPLIEALSRVGRVVLYSFAGSGWRLRSGTAYAVKYFGIK
jgi:hypothetical protein